jgi:hypothetical protein
VQVLRTYCIYLDIGEEEEHAKDEPNEDHDAGLWQDSLQAGYEVVGCNQRRLEITE